VVSVEEVGAVWWKVERGEVGKMGKKKRMEERGRENC
jgi:hypothetical protein